MEEAVEDAPGAGTQEAEAESPLEKTAETGSEDRPIGREDYQQQNSERKYSKKVEYRKASKETASKKTSANKSGLEEVVANSGVIAKEFGVDQTELLSAKLAQHSMWYVRGSRDLSNDEEKKIKDSRDTPNGAGYIIWTKNPKTGVVYVSTEIKTASYRYVEARGKLALHGETSQVGENNPLETAVRGLMEENPKSYQVLLNAWRENGSVYDRVKADVEGVPSETTFIQIQVPWELWGKYVSDKNPEAPKVIMSLDEIFTTKKSDWAFNNYDVLMGFIEKNWDRLTQIRSSAEKGNNLVPFAYSDSIMPKYSSLSTQILNSKNIQQYKTQFQISSGIYNPN